MILPKIDPISLGFQDAESLRAHQTDRRIALQIGLTALFNLTVTSIALFSCELSQGRSCPGYVYERIWESPLGPTTLLVNLCSLGLILQRSKNSL